VYRQLSRIFTWRSSSSARILLKSHSLTPSFSRGIIPLGDGVILCHAHGAGSVCGGAIGERERSTPSLQRVLNPVLQKKKEEFIEFKLSERHGRPPYFRKMEQYNLEGPPILGHLPNPKPLSPKESFKNRWSLAPWL